MPTLHTRIHIYYIHHSSHTCTHINRNSKQIVALRCMKLMFCDITWIWDRKQDEIYNYPSISYILNGTIAVSRWSKHKKRTIYWKALKKEDFGKEVRKWEIYLKNGSLPDKMGDLECMRIHSHLLSQELVAICLIFSVYVWTAQLLVTSSTLALTGINCNYWFSGFTYESHIAFIKPWQQPH